MIRHLYYRFLYYSGVASFSKFFFRRAYCAILVYHRVCPLNTKNDLLKDLIVEPNIFERQIKYIKKNCNVVSLNYLINSLLNGQEFYKNCVVITFDDAYEDNYTYTFPVLRNYNLPATIFVPTAFVGNNRIFGWERLALILKNTKKSQLEFQHKNRRYSFKLKGVRNKLKIFKSISRILKYCNEIEENTLLNTLSDLLDIKEKLPPSRILSWNQIKEMSAHNITFGAHAHTHQCLSILDNQKINDELYVPKKLLEQYLDKEVISFAYPYGEDSDFTRNSIDMVAKAGYKSALTMIQGFVFSNDNIFVLRRIGMGRNDTDEILKLKLAGLIPWYSNLCRLTK